MLREPPELPITFSSIDEGADGLGEWWGIDIGGFSSIYNGNPSEAIACTQRVVENANHEGSHDGRDVPLTGVTRECGKRYWG